MYIIMPCLGINLQNLFEERNGFFTSEQVYTLGIQILNILEQVHATGFVFNDLKLDNLLLNFDADVKSISKSKGNFFDSHNINMIDFGFATSYVLEDGKTHIKKCYVDFFRGNMVFSSLNQLKFHATSRRDDIIAVLYIMVYLLKNGQLPGINFDEAENDNDNDKMYK